jgi:inner membrane protein involved in colicin E2 resistance
MDDYFCNTIAMLTRLVAITFIFVCASIAWAVLGGTILYRTNSSDDRLRQRVQSVWGVPQTQEAPALEYSVPHLVEETIDVQGRKQRVERTRLESHILPPSASEIGADLVLDYRQKGLLWYSTYSVAFRGEYQFLNATGASREMRLTLPLPAAQAVYDDLQFTVDGITVAPEIGVQQASVPIRLAPEQTVRFRVSYRSQGVESWKYSFGQNVKSVQNFHLVMTTNFKDIDFPENTLAPGAKRENNNGWRLDWNYRNLLSGYSIAMAMPARLQPGPLASEISFFAPVSLFFFFFVMFIIATRRNIELHPMNYFFLAAAFFAFHLLLAYLADHLDIRLAFLIASAVSISLVTTYLRIVAGTKFALREAAVAQFIYLVLFSSAFFFKGFTGLAITIGAIVTLFVAMQMTASIRWSERFSRATPPPLPASGS